MKIIGHRGARGYAPENTLLSMKTALDLGVDMVEFDVYALPSGELMVMHDHRVDRTTDGQGRILHHSFDNLRRLDAGDREKVPTLTEVLDTLDAQIVANIELKGPKTALLVAEVITRYINQGWHPSKFLISSFDHHELQLFKLQMPEVPIAVLEHTIPLSYASVPQEMGAAAVNPNFEFLTPEYVRDAHQRGLKVYPYTVNFPDDMHDLRKMGVDGVITDFPDVARRMLRAKTELGLAI